MSRTAVLQRPAVKSRDEQLNAVTQILQKVQMGGDAALLELTLQLDKVKLSSLRVDKAEITNAGKQLTDAQRQAIEVAHRNISRFHQAQMPQAISIETQAGIQCEKHYHPLDSVGLYIPGGTAPLPSTVLMTAIPAQIAKCPVRVICTPPQADGHCHPAILAAAHLCGVEDIFLVGGAQAIAAMAYGSETVPKVNKIFGPGNSWVTMAKTLVSQDPAGCAIDMPAGPSEVMVIADENGRADFIASDLLSQAEHGPDSQVVFVSTSDELMDRVSSECERQCNQLSRGNTARQALSHSIMIAVKDIESAIEVANRYAPEHLIIHCHDTASLRAKIRNAGSVFLGEWTPESFGDYASGTNHVLPTYGYARAYSGLGLMDFMRGITFQTANQVGFNALADTVHELALMEGLDAHANAVKIRQHALAKENA